MKTIRAVLVYSMLLASVGCWKDEAQKMLDASKELSGGLKGLDPLGLKTLLDTNAELRARLTDLAARVNAASGIGGTLVAETDQITFEAPNYTGAFIVNATLDGTPLWHTEYALKGGDGPASALQPATHSAILALAQSSVNGCVYKGQDCATLNFNTNLESALSGPVAKACLDFVRVESLVPIDHIQALSLQVNGLSKGIHVLAFVVTPVQRASDGHWFFRAQVKVKHPNNVIDVPDNYDFSDHQFPSAPMDAPLPPQKFTLKVG